MRRSLWHMPLIIVLATVLALIAGGGPARTQDWFSSGSQPAAPPQSAESAALSLRIDRLEELVRRLTGEVEMLRHQLGEAAPVGAPAQMSAPTAVPSYVVPPGAAPSSAGAGAAMDSLASSSALPGPEATAPAPASAPSDLSQTGDRPTSLLPVPEPSYLPDGATGLGAPAVPLGSVPASMLRGAQGDLAAIPAAAPAAPATGDGGIEKAYADAYGHLVADDMAGAEAGFAAFLSRYPEHRLSGNAQYWLGETFFVRGDYRRAAQEFLTGYQRYATSDKAPDSLLKLGMTLAALGQTTEACASFAEVRTRFPNADAAVLDRAATEHANAGCAQ